MLSLLLPGITRGLSDTLICDNGGFEDDFDFYTGATTSYYNGSSTCSPLRLGGLSPNYVNQSLPTYRWFDIASYSNDPLTSYPKVRFGEKSLALGDLYGRYSDCKPGGRVHRITKRFKVTEENRNFTFWYSVVLHNPDDIGHVGSQPFFNIKCDLATNSDLCFDGISLPTNVFAYPSGDCYTDDEPYKATNWVCHRVFIDKEHIGDIATIQISIAGCGFVYHFGYAFIDGFCEPCAGSSYGSGTFSNKSDIILSCDGDSITIKGSYTQPSLDGDYTNLDSITIPGFNIYGLEIDTATKTFRFRVVKTDFESPYDDCRDVIAYLYFGNGTNELPAVPTNSIEICDDDFVIPDIDVTIGECNRNDPYDNVFSDDYYYVEVTISRADGISWTLERQLDDPYPNESGHYILKTGTGSAHYYLGPFFIQEESWDLIFNHNHCTDTIHISPPDYCSGCAQLAKTKIDNIICKNDGDWTFDVTVPYGDPLTNESLIVDNNDASFNTTITIEAGSVNGPCKHLVIEYKDENDENNNCIAEFDICPPKPCVDNEGCELEAYITKINCVESGSSYTVDLDVSGSEYPCFRSIGAGNNGGGSFANPLGPFTDDIRLIIYSCTSPSTCTCPNDHCFKSFFIHKPEDCETRTFWNSSERSRNSSNQSIWIQPNPVVANEFIIHSEFDTTEFELISSTGIILTSGSFKGSEFVLRKELTSGLYFLRYKNSNREYSSIKFLKL